VRLGQTHQAGQLGRHLRGAGHVHDAFHLQVEDAHRQLLAVDELDLAAGGPAERVEDGVGGLQFELGDHRALARVMRRCATEEGLWEHLRETLPVPPGRGEMVEGFASDAYMSLES